MPHPQIYFGSLPLTLFKAMSNSSQQKASVFVSDNHFHPRTNDKHSSLLRKTAIYVQKSFITFGPGFRNLSIPSQKRLF